ncbi:hypothetical protein [Aliamphritea spongicola]|nr:hypothetical protein [Aliamphritea spongicola]
MPRFWNASAVFDFQDLYLSRLPLQHIYLLKGVIGETLLSELAPTGMDAHKPAEITRRIRLTGIAKAEMALVPLITLSILAGIFIGFGALFIQKLPPVWMFCIHRLYCSEDWRFRWG